MAITSRLSTAIQHNMAITSQLVLDLSYFHLQDNKYRQDGKYHLDLDSFDTGSDQGRIRTP